MSIRSLLFSLIVASLAPSAALAQATPEAARAALGQTTAEDRVLGRAEAPVTVVAFVSFTCPHCAAWHRDVLPAFKARFIDTGQVKLVYRDLPTQPQALSQPAAALARCAAPETYYKVAEALMDGQAAVRAGGEPSAWLQPAADRAGRPVEALVACMEDPATTDAIDAGVEDAIAAGITGTPRFLVNGELVQDGSLNALGAVITALLPATP